MSVDWHTYSSTYGSVLEIIRNPAMLEQIRSMLFEDPPIHDIHRAILSRALDAAAGVDLEPRVRQLCADFLDPFVGSGGFDFVQDFGMKLPMMVIGALLGVPEEDQEMVRQTADELLHIDEGESMTSMSPHIKMAEYMTGLVAERRKKPTDDFISVLTRRGHRDAGRNPQARGPRAPQLHHADRRRRQRDRGAADGMGGADAGPQPRPARHPGR